MQMTQIDTISSQILKSLFEPEIAALNVEAISKKLGVHRLTVSRRLKSLYKEKIITQVMPRLEWSELGKTLLTLHLMKLRVDDIDASIKTSKKSKEILAYGDVSSERDINRFELSVHDNLESYIANEERRKGPRLSVHHTILTHIPLKGLTHWPIVDLIKNAPGLEKYDTLTGKILTEIFTKDYVRINENAIAKKVGVNRLTVKRRIEKLKNSGLIRRIAPEINWQKVGLPFSVITLIDFEANQRDKIMKTSTTYGRIRWSGACTSESTLNTFILSLHPDLQNYVWWMKKIKERHEKHFGGGSIRAFLPTSMVTWNDPRKLLPST